MSSRDNKKSTHHFKVICFIFSLTFSFFLLSSAPLGDTDLHHSVDQSIKDISDPQNSISRVRIQPPAEESFELQVGMCNSWTGPYAIL